MKNLLFISSHLPSDGIPQAGQKIALDLLNEYAESYNVYLIAFTNRLEKPYVDASIYGSCREVAFFYVTKLDKIKSILLNILLPINASVRSHSEAKKTILNLHKKVRFDVVHFEFTSAAYYANCFDLETINTTITEHDIIYQRIERKINTANSFYKFLYKYEYKRQIKWELELLHKMNKVIVLSSKDKYLLASDGISEDKIVVRAPKIKDCFYKIERTAIEKNSLLFWGAMNREENADAIRWFIKAILPEVQLCFNDVKLYIVGADPPSDILKLNSEHIIVTGFVDDPLPYFEKCHVAIAPLRMGAGIKIKVLECLASGLSVVATNVGAEGIDLSSKIIVADDPSEFSSAICSLLNLSE